MSAPGWPATLRHGPVVVRPLRWRDGSAWVEVRVRNEAWLAPWEGRAESAPDASWAERHSGAVFVAMRRSMRREAPGIVEALRRTRQDEVPTTILSRGVAGTTARTFVLNLPGSTGAVRDGVAVLRPVVGHLVAQLRGGGHHD